MSGPCRVVLVGMMGSGKSAVGDALALRTGWPFHDNDRLLADATGRTARQIAADGEPALRAAESAALHLAVGMPEPAIVAVAGGAVLDPANRRLLAASGYVVWLRTDPSVLAVRARDAEHRPWLAGNAEAWLAAAAADREPLYREVTAYVLDTDATTPDRLAEAIIRDLAAGSCARWLSTRVGESSRSHP